MKTLLTTIAAAMFFAAACTKSEKESTSPIGVVKGSSDIEPDPVNCEYRAIVERLDTATTCTGMFAVIEPCLKQLCKHELAEVVNYADHVAANGSFGPCDWSWLPEGLPCE